MKNCQFKRARQPKQKEQRRAQIMDSAAFLLERDGFEKVSLNGIARHCHIAKSNIYRYFDSREDIFLQMLLDDWTDWLATTERMLEPLQDCHDVELVAKNIADAVIAAPRMCQLISVVGAVLENNISDEQLFQFKYNSVQLALRLMSALSGALPKIKQNHLLAAVQSIFALIAGMWPLTNPSEQVSRIMQSPELAAFKWEFEPAIRQAILLVALGAYNASIEA